MTQPKQKPAARSKQPATTTTPDPAAVTPVGRILTAPERGQWQIDDKLYDMRNLNDFGLRTQRRLNRDGREFYALWTAEDDLTDDQDMRLEFLLDRMFLGDERTLSLIDAPREILERIGPADRADVVLTFTLAPLQKLMAAAPAAETKTEKTGMEPGESASITTS